MNKGLAMLLVSTALLANQCEKDAAKIEQPESLEHVEYGSARLKAVEDSLCAEAKAKFSPHETERPKPVSPCGK